MTHFFIFLFFGFEERERKGVVAFGMAYNPDNFAGAGRRIDRMRATTGYARLHHFWWPMSEPHRGQALGVLAAG